MEQDNVLTVREQAILQALAIHRALTGPQLATALAARPQLVNRDLARLAARQLVIGQPCPGNGVGRTPRLWRLRKAGAAAAGVTDFGTHYYRAPAEDLLRHRGVESTLRRQLAAVPGWQLLAPQPGGLTRAAGETPQCRQLRAALAARGYGMEVAGYVPQRCHDYVVYRPDDPTRTTLLIVPPPRATRLYWTRPRPPYNSRARRPLPPGRLVVYRDLVRWLPDRIAALFPDETRAEPYVDLIEAAGILVLLADPPGEVSHFLATLGERPGP